MNDNEIDLHLCPICGSSLPRDIFFDDRDNLIIFCENCGKFGLTVEYYEDEIKTASDEYKGLVRSFLESHKFDLLRPLISYFLAPAPEGYKNYLWSQVVK